MTCLTIIVPDEAELLEAAKQANAQHLRLLTNGKHSVLSPMPLPGYRPMIIKVKPAGEERQAA